MLRQFKQQVKARKSKNIAFVKIRTMHNCYHCLRAIPSGTECLTINPRGSGRYWLCNDCLVAWLNIKQARAAMNNVAFGDEGAYMACMEWESEALDEWDELGEY